MHSAIAIVGSVVCVFLGGIILGIILRVVGLGPIRAADAWYGPFVWWPGLLLGFLVNRRTHQRAACFVWLPGMLLLAYGILECGNCLATGGDVWMTRVRIELFPLQQDHCGECLGQPFYTWPALNSITYSIGAALALLSKRGAINSEEPPSEYITPSS